MSYKLKLCKSSLLRSICWKLSRCHHSLLNWFFKQFWLWKLVPL